MQASTSWDDVAFSSTEGDRHPGIRPVSQLNTWPVVSPVNASRRPSRDAAHHSGSGRMASPYPVGDFHLLFFASFPGALRVGPWAESCGGTRVAWTMPGPLTRSPSSDAANHAAATPKPVGSTRLCGARTAMRVTIAEISAQPAIAYNPASKLPVLSLSQPTRLGPIRPPRLPTELIAAMAAAAAVPLKKLEGSGQNEVFMP